MKQNPGSRRGFTLIELLVVIAIIAILAAILFPVFMRAKESAKVSSCISNLRQINGALQSYVDDSNGRYPNAANLGREINVEQQGQKTLVQLLAKYAKTSLARGGNPNADKVFTSAGIFACPGDIGYPPGVTWDVSGIRPIKGGRVAIWEQSGTSYDYVGTDQHDWANTRAGTGIAKNPDGSVKLSGLAPNGAGAPSSAIRFPSRKGVLSDAWNWHMTESTEGMDTAHRNTLFADGHATRTWFKDFCYCRTEPLSPWY